MDEAKRKTNDEKYDWWSAEGHHKLISIVCPSKRAIAIANQWHEYFLWKPIEEKVHPTPRFGACTDARAYKWSTFAFYDVFFKRISAPYSGWGKDIERFSDANIYEKIVGYTILYERAVDTPYLKELGELQDECEELVGRLGTCFFDIESAEETLRKMFAFGKPEARKEKEEAEHKIPPLREQLDQHLARVNEIRAIVLGS